MTNGTAVISVQTVVSTRGGAVIHGQQRRRISEAAFSRAFKKVADASPARWRERRCVHGGI